ncbi:MAG: hypothetical protein RQ732_07160, partial [Methylophaga sp.]|nr:hypothetical protein [Methylophaga sp.]
VLRWQPSPSINKDLLCWCPTTNYGQTISQRLQSLLVDLLRFQHHNADNGRYLLRSGQQFWQLQWQDSLIETEISSRTLSEWRNQIDAKTIASRVDPLLDNSVKANASQR